MNDDTGLQSHHPIEIILAITPLRILFEADSGTQCCPCLHSIHIRAAHSNHKGQKVNDFKIKVWILKHTSAADGE